MVQITKKEFYDFIKENELGLTIEQIPGFVFYYFEKKIIAYIKTHQNEKQYFKKA